MAHANNMHCILASLIQKKQTVLHIAARAEQLDCLKEIVPKASDDLKIATDKVTGLACADTENLYIDVN
jgi:hypothetical protein